MRPGERDANCSKCNCEMEMVLLTLYINQNGRAGEAACPGGTFDNSPAFPTPGSGVPSPRVPQGRLTNAQIYLFKIRPRTRILSRPCGTYWMRNVPRRWKRRAIIICPSGTGTPALSRIHAVGNHGWTRRNTDGTGKSTPPRWCLATHPVVPHFSPAQS